MEAIEAANAELRSRVRELEAENDRLRIRLQALGGDAEDPALGPLRASVDPRDGAAVAATGASMLRVTHGTGADHWISFQVVTGDASDTARVLVNVQTRFSGGIYRGAKTLLLMPDDETVECEVVDYRATQRTSGGPRKRIRRDDELVSARVPPSAFSRFDGVRTLKGQLRHVRFVLSPTQVAALRQVIREAGGRDN